MANAVDSVFDTLSKLTKKYGKPVAYMGSDIPSARKIPLDIPIADFVLTGGIAVNRVTEIYGDFSSLKSYMTYVAAGKFQKYDWANHVPNAFAKVTTKKEKSKSRDESFEGFVYASVDKITLRRGYKPVKEPKVKRVALIDIEGTYDREWGARLGIDNDLLIYLSPDSLNTAIDITDALLRDPDICLVILDSMSAMGSDAEVDSSMENEQMAVNARLWNKAARKITAAMNSNSPANDVTFIGINRAYDKVGFVLGDPEKVANGKGFSLAKSISIKMSAVGKAVTGKINGEGPDVSLGRNIKISNKKNKVGTPFLEGTFYYSYVDDGYLQKGDTDVLAQLVELGVRFSLITKKANHYSFGEISGNGMENFKNALRENITGQRELKEAVYQIIVK
jgi:recombination protein RecA